MTTLELLQVLVVWGARLVVAAVLIIAGLAKMAAIRQFEATLEGFGLLPPRLNGLVARTLPWLEVTTGCAVAADYPTPWAALFAVALFIVFAIAVGIRLALGADGLKCGCFGRRADALSWRLVVRDLAFATLSIVAVAPPEQTVFLFVFCVLLWAPSMAATQD
jgi:uncharacterized membrane protein YphA (DoxX/SURF4 family)